MNRVHRNLFLQSLDWWRWRCNSRGFAITDEVDIILSPRRWAAVLLTTVFFQSCASTREATRAWEDPYKGVPFDGDGGYSVLSNHQTSITKANNELSFQALRHLTLSPIDPEGDNVVIDSTSLVLSAMVLQDLAQGEARKAWSRFFSSLPASGGFDSTRIQQYLQQTRSRLNEQYCLDYDLNHDVERGALLFSLPRLDDTFDCASKTDEPFVIAEYEYPGVNGLWPLRIPVNEVLKGTIQGHKNNRKNDSNRDNVSIELRSKLVVSMRWRKVYRTTDIQTRDFSLPSGDKRELQYVHNWGPTFGYSNKSKGFSLIAMSTAQDEVYGVFVLPTQTHSLHRLLQSITWKDLATGLQSLSLYAQAVSVRIPRVTAEFPRRQTTLSYAELLENLGCKGCFPPSSGNHPSAKYGNLLIQSDHRSRIELMSDANFTLAKPKVAYLRTHSGVGIVPRVFHLDRPFLFFLVDKTSGSVLLAATILEAQDF